MKKKATLVNQPGKTETIKPELSSHHHTNQKLYRDCTFCDHSHGRINKFPFGSTLGPHAF